MSLRRAASPLFRRSRGLPPPPLLLRFYTPLDGLNLCCCSLPLPRAIRFRLPTKVENCFIVVVIAAFGDTILVFFLKGITISIGARVIRDAATTGVRAASAPWIGCVHAASLHGIVLASTATMNGIVLARATTIIIVDWSE